MVVYANEIDSKNNILEKVFIYDERNARSPMTIIANRGQVIQESSMLGQKAFLRLFDGNIHRTQEEVYTKIDFETFDINLYDPVKQTEKTKTPLSYNLKDLKQAFENKDKFEPKFFKKLEIEYFRRSALAFTCLIFALLGVGLGTTTNKRSGKSNGLVLSIGIVVSFWIIYAGMESMAKSGTLPVSVAVWVGNVAFLIFAIFKLHKART